MNKRELILDFTSLLDVIMIILFFFILFSRLETTGAISRAEEKEKTAQEILSEAEEKFSAADEAEKLAGEILSEAKLSKEREGQNAEGIIEFSQSKNFRIKLKMNGSEWSLIICKGEEQIAELEKAPTLAMSRALSGVFSEAGAKTDDTILCEFVYDGSESGTNSAYESVENVFDILKTEYGHFFFSEIDLSAFGE